MFCSKCGTPMGDALVACPSCSHPMTTGAAFRAGAGAAVTSAAREALAAVRTFATDPVGGLPRAHEALGEARALRAGIALGAVSVACFLLGGYFLLPPFVREDLFEFLGFGGVMKSLFFAVVPFLATVIGGLGVRKLMGGQGALGGDCFIAGAALLPSSLAMAVSGMLGLANFGAIGVLGVFAGCTGVLMLFSGYTRISKLGERAGAVAVPIVVLLSMWLAKVLATSVITGPGNGGMPSDFPF